MVMDRRRAEPPTRYDGGSWDLLRDPRHCDLSFCFREEAALHAARVVLHGDSLSFWLYVVGRIEFKLSRQAEQGKQHPSRQRQNGQALGWNRRCFSRRRQPTAVATTIAAERTAAAKAASAKQRATPSTTAKRLARESPSGCTRRRMCTESGADSKTRFDWQQAVMKGGGRGRSAGAATSRGRFPCAKIAWGQ